MAEIKAKPKAWADGIPVYCAHDAIVDITKLKPNPANPNKHPDEQIQLLGRVITEHNGWRAPITVSNRSGLIVKGHGRLSAALLEGLKEVPVDFQNYDSNESELADLVADNRIAELAEIDQKMLADIFAEIDTGAIPMEATGFNETEVEELITAMSESLHNEVKDPDETLELKNAVTQPGDLWIFDNRCVMCEDGESFKTEINPESCDAIVQDYIRVTGKTDVRLIRKGHEIDRAEYQRIFAE